MLCAGKTRFRLIQEAIPTAKVTVIAIALLLFHPFCTVINESQIEYGFIGTLQELKYTYRSDIRDSNALELNFRQKFETLNQVKLSDAEFHRLRDEIINPDVFVAAKTLRGQNTFIREDGTPLHYTLVNIKDWCKNEFKVVNQLRINTTSSHHRHDAMQYY